MSNAMLGYGSVFEVQTETSPDVFVAIAEVISIKPPTFKLDQIDVTHMASPNRNREFISGLNDPGECSFDINFIPGNATDDRMFELLSLPTGLPRGRICRCSYPNGLTWTFTAELVGYEPNIPVDDKMTATITFKVSGQISVGTT